MTKIFDTVKYVNNLVKKILDNELYFLLIQIIFVISTMLLSSLMYTQQVSNNYFFINIILSMLFSIVFSKNILLKFKENPISILPLISFFFSIYIIKICNFTSSINTSIGTFYFYDFTRKIFKLISLFSLTLYILYGLQIIINYLIQIFKDMDEIEKKYFALSTFFFIIVIILVYSRTSGFYEQYDLIYSADSGWITNSLFPNLHYIDIRHLFLSIITFPIDRVIYYTTTILYLPIVWYHIFIAIVNLFFLLLISIMLKRMSNSKWILWLYTLSNPFLIFSLMNEKYQIITFLLVLFVYSKYKKNNQLQLISLPFSIGAMSTTAFIGILMFDMKNIKKSIINCIKSLLIFIGIISIRGNILFIIESRKIISNMLSGIGIHFTMLQRVNSFTSLIASSLFAIPYKVINNTFTWVDVIGKINIIGVLILIIISYGFFVNRKNQLFQISMYWIAFSFILLFGFQWFCHESPLFSIYFSWAIILMLVMTFESLLKNKYKIKLIIYISIIVCMGIINLIHMYQMYKFLTIRF